jgi:hypothetical protein
MAPRQPRSKTLRAIIDEPGEAMVVGGGDNFAGECAGFDRDV